MLQSTLNDNISIHPIPAFTDNYIWALINKHNQSLVLVDPGNAKVCIEFIEQEQLQLTDILITHHHNDHIGGLSKLAQYCELHNWPLSVSAPENITIPLVSNVVKENDIVTLTSLDLSFTIIELPGHTLDHIAYYSEPEQLLFCGDTLFSGGCGRIFEGSPEQMFSALSKLADLPDNTKVYCTHEYTLANLNFALTVEPTNIDLVDYYNHCQQIRANKMPTLPSNILLEKKINPFLRTHSHEVQMSADEYRNAENHTELDVFTTLRQWKDNF